ncbi:glycosyltransferase family 4 protein [Jaapia argillacea MUCL 33604]|uniref:Glycosyltransferase family 4 protein n=1 Tax=Jaapia argillacea MUCL 33604 TaxID=933084 RepID=A0A067PV23_9AGAM|nr:glycosyltransferase family 4 protein [Jaapia argillacea MUCL 33604]
MGTVESECGIKKDLPDSYDIMDILINKAKKYCEARGHRIEIFAVSGPLDAPLTVPGPLIEVDRNARPSFVSRLWLELDAIPFIFNGRDQLFSLQGEAVWAVERALDWLAPTTKSITKASTLKGEVLVDADGHAHLYDLSQQAALTSPDLWETFCALASPLKDKGVKVSFFSATPRGGGVALMRHALVRVWRLAGLDFRWYVPQGDPTVFDITKRRFHNVLQGVAPDDITLRAEDKRIFERWTEWNYKTFWSGEDSPLRADIIVIDDPQLTALIPMIRRDSPSSKIIYRSHIEIRADLIDAGKKQTKDTFEYLFNFIKHADLFVSHPIEEFVPKMVSESMPVVFMPPSTDPLDGLNKPIAEFWITTYRHMFDSLMHASTGQQLDWERGYIIQVARFDPSKGIPDLVEGYRLFRREVKEEQLEGAAPQLILIGHSSVDDPDGTYIINKLRDTTSSPPFADIKDDIYYVRAPAEDRLLDALMRGADLVCQVSTREGFEIKVTEAIHKNKWIIATKAGGIPLQIRDGVDGKLVPPADPNAIAMALAEFYSSGKELNTSGESRGNCPDKPLGGRWAGNEGEGPREELFTIGNATITREMYETCTGRRFGIFCRRRSSLIKDIDYICICTLAEVRWW